MLRYERIERPELKGLQSQINEVAQSANSQVQSLSQAVSSVAQQLDTKVNNLDTKVTTKITSVDTTLTDNVSTINAKLVDLSDRQTKAVQETGAKLVELVGAEQVVNQAITESTNAKIDEIINRANGVTEQLVSEMSEALADVKANIENIYKVIAE